MPSASSKQFSALVLFPDDWAPYSPSLTRLVEKLDLDFSVKVIALDTGRYDFRTLRSDIYQKIFIKPLIAKILRKTGLMHFTRTLLLFWRARALAQNSTVVIAVDSGGAIAGRLLRVPMHFMSLEIQRLSLARWIVPKYALSILIQSKERLNYQFSPQSISRIPVFYVQNAPALDTFPLTRTRNTCSRPRLIYMGNVIGQHGLHCMLELLRIWSDATLTLQGIVPESSNTTIQNNYSDLISGGRLFIKNDYIPEPDIGNFLSGFDIGLCLYESKASGQLNFNYQSAPAGKMFNYFAAGLPVIASDLIGLRPVSEFQAGIQSLSNHPDAIMKAGVEICRNYSTYQSGAKKAAEYFDFSRASKKYIDFLKSTQPAR